MRIGTPRLAPALAVLVVLAGCEPFGGEGDKNTIIQRVEGELPAPTSVAPASASNDQAASVTITGTRFTGATAVNVGSTALTGLAVASDTQITASVPAGLAAGSYPLTVTTPKGTGVAGFVFTVLDAQPAVGSVSPSSGRNFGTTALTVQGTRLTGASAARLGSTDLTGLAVASATRLTATVPSGMAPGTYALEVTTPAGTSRTPASFTVLDGTPTLTGVTPGTVTAGTATALALTGTNLDAPAASLSATLTPVGGGSTVGLTAGTLAAGPGGTTLSGFSVPATATRGTYNLQVTVSVTGGSLTSAASPAVQVRLDEAAHLLITEALPLGTEEFVEIYNPTGASVSLDGYYLTDALDDAVAGNGRTYWKVTDPTTRANASSGVSSDFHVGFPSGSTLAAGAYAVIAVKDQEPFTGAFFKRMGANPDYEIALDGDTIPNMVAAPGQPLNTNAGLDNATEAVVLYSWDGSSILVKDVDFFLYGSGAALDAVHLRKNNPPQGGAGTHPLDPPFGGSTVYRTDTAIADQDVFIITKGGGALPVTHGSDHDQSFQRRSLAGSSYAEDGERASGGNGATGHDESSERWTIAWSSDELASPGRRSAFSPVPGATGVSTGTNVTAYLPRDFVNAATVTGTSFTLTDLYTGAAVAATVSWAPTTETATLDPTAALTADHLYRATLTNAITYTDGATTGPYLTAATSYSWEFYTGAVASTVAQGGILIDEVLGQPDGAADDPNGDAAFSTTNDEFVELVNTTSTAIDLGGFTLWDNTTTQPRHIFAPATVIPPGGVVVVFGGGTVANFPTTGANGRSANVLGLAASSGALGMDNTGETVVLQDRGGREVDRFVTGAFSASKSRNRAGDGLVAARSLLHDTVVGHEAAGGAAGREWSAGRLANQGFPRRVVINEVLAQPAATDDPNGDGAPSLTADEFVELVNTTGSALGLSGFTLTNGAAVIHTFGATASIPALGSMVVFGGGNPTGFTTAQVASTWPALPGLVDGGDTITLKDAGGVIVDSFTYPATTQGESFNRTTDCLSSGGVGLHTAVTGAGTSKWSPSKRVTQDALPYVVINEVFPDPDGAADDTNGDGAFSVDADEFIEVLNRTGSPVGLGGYTLRDLAGATLYTVPAGTTIPAYGSLVIFGGGTPTGFPPAGQSGAALVKTAPAGFALVNAAAVTAVAVGVSLHDAGGTRVSLFQYDNGTNFTAPVQRKSLNRFKDGANTGTAVGTKLVLHDAAEGQAAPGTGGQYSPGRRTDQTRFP
ncbi:MAG: lamin tail domain-containing protein [Planctomycetes bacterium]|nr:lamin tail domain-containing protein [Planctomycetota bacterium]